MRNIVLCILVSWENCFDFGYNLSMRISDIVSDSDHNKTESNAASNFRWPKVARK